MPDELKYAILDTDFVSKANIISTKEHALADEVLAFPGYRFFCHQKMKEELSDHGTLPAQAWLDSMVADGTIVCYSDEKIVFELRKLASDNCLYYYRSFLKKGCDLFKAGFYEEYFGALDEFIESGTKDDIAFLSVLKSCEAFIGHGQNYGEVKAYVLSQTLWLIHGVETYIFCSDDFHARQGFANGAQIPCISILSVFLKLKYIGKSKEELLPYFQSYIRWNSERDIPQTQVKVWEYSYGSDKRIKVPSGTILDDIYAGVYETRKNGDLQRKQYRSTERLMHLE